MDADDKQTDRAAALTDRAGGYDTDSYPEEPGSATPPVDDKATEPPRGE